MIQIFIAVTFFTFLVIFAYIKLKYPFWNNQPMFHIYDYWRYFYRFPFVVYPSRPMKTKFCDFQRIKTVPYLEAKDEEKNEFTNLLQCYYISTERIFHTVVRKDIDAYFSGSKEPPFISLYKEPGEPRFPPDPPPLLPSVTSNPHLLIGGGSGGNLGSPGCIASRSVQFFFRPTLSEQVYTQTPIYYIDSLCVHRGIEKRKTEISRKLLQTHEYNQRVQNPNITVSVIKAEIQLFDGMVPLFQYDVYTYNLRNLFFEPLPRFFQLTQLYKENLEILTEFLYTQTHPDFSKEKCDFDICLIPDVGTLISLIKRRLLYVYTVHRNGNIYGIYFIKNAKLRYEDVDGNTLQLIGSIMTYEGNDGGALFYSGFLHTLQHIIKKKPSYKMLLIDDIGHNQIITSYWRKKNTPIFKNDAAYYLFNMIFPCSPILSSRCLVLHC